MNMLISEYVTMKWNSNNVKWYKNNGYIYTKIGDEFDVLVEHLPIKSSFKVKVQCDYCNKIIEKKYNQYLYSKNEKSVDKDACSGCRIKKQEDCNLVTFGVANVFQLERVKEKSKNTMFKKYGYEYNSQIPDIKEQKVKKLIKAMYKNGTSPCSSQQKYIHDILKGELNYPIDTLMLDIAYPEEGVYIEYQGSGHDLNVKFNKVSQEEFSKREMNRYYFLKNKGWKMIEIISKKDKLPKKEKLLEILDFSREILNNTSFIQFNIDNGTVKYNKKYYDYDFGELITYGTLNYAINNNTYDKLIK